MIFYKNQKIKPIIDEIKIRLPNKEKAKIIVMSWDRKLTDNVTKALQAIDKGVQQYNIEKKQLDPPAWKKILNYVFNIAKIILEWYIKTKGIDLTKLIK